ncbi:MAG: hypothetical protein LBJ80_03960 [Rickettsiales bacterium]|jgi:hypothetical protein|nr:hypothetical protein [Rickettsiales bacterium]MDR1261544.1 hypothetical protein [Rickettsiales bacterium]
MPISEKVKKVSQERLEQLEYSHKTEHLQSSTAIYGHVNEHMEENISSTLREIYDALISYNNSEHLSNDEAIGNMAKRFQESIEKAKKNKVMFSVPCHIDVFEEEEKLSIIEYSMKVLRHLMEYDANVTEVGRSKLQPLWLEMSNLVSKGNSVSTSVFQSEKLPNILQGREDYLSSLKQIVCDSIENDKKEGIIVERDNEFYCVKCPEESVITPAKFLNNPEFKNLDGALKFGEGDVIRTQNGQYCDMKGVLQMAFEVGDGEKIEMVLFSENTSGFGKVMVHMDNKSCEIFSKHCEELEKESRISKVVEAAKSFVQNKAVSPPLSSMDDTDTSNHLENIGQSANQNVG